MASCSCPNCKKSLELSVVKGLTNKRAIYCPYCSKAIRVNQSYMIKTMVVFGFLSGLIGTRLFDISTAELVFIMITFSLIYSHIFMHFIGLLFPLEVADDEDLLL